MTRIGTRMARPEKAKEREMTPKVHALFPIGKDAEAKNELIAAIAVCKSNASKSKGGKNEVSVEVGNRFCPVCRDYTYRNWCRVCGSHTTYTPRQNNFGNMGPVEIGINLEEEFKAACDWLHEKPPSDLKCLETLSSKTKTCEALEKGILRQKNGVSTFKDGTIRFDMTDIPLTHFKPREIGLSIEKAHELGYTHDWNGDPLTDPEQICELKVQEPRTAARTWSTSPGSSTTSWRSSTTSPGTTTSRTGTTLSATSRSPWRPTRRAASCAG